MKSYFEIHNALDEAYCLAYSTGSFSGFRHENCSRVKNMIKDSLIKLKKSCDRDQNGMPMIGHSLFVEVLDGVGERIKRRGESISDELDNGSTKNKLLFLSLVRMELTK